MGDQPQGSRMPAGRAWPSPRMLQTPCPSLRWPPWLQQCQCVGGAPTGLPVGSPWCAQARLRVVLGLSPCPPPPSRRYARIWVIHEDGAPAPRAAAADSPAASLQDEILRYAPRPTWQAGECRWVGGGGGAVARGAVGVLGALGPGSWGFLPLGASSPWGFFPCLPGSCGWSSWGSWSWA